MTCSSRPAVPSFKAVFVLSSLIACLLGCGGTSVTTTHPTPVAISIQAPANAIDPTNSAALSATVTDDATGSGVTWILSGTSCSGAACGTLSNSTTTAVTYTAPATVATALSVTVTATSVANSSVSATAMLNVAVNPAITTAAGALAGGTVGAVYTQALAGSGGISPYTWSVSSGMLPAGLSLGTSTGAITGMPTAAGSQTFGVTLTDSGSPALTATATYTIAIAYPALAVTTSTLPNATLGTTYTAALAASGGSGTGYVWTVTSGTGLSAAGLTLSGAGVISGIPTAAENAVPFTVQVTDSAGDTATATLAITVINVNFQGQVFSGQLPVSGANVQIYATGAIGTGSASVPMLTQPVSTDNAGNFSIAGLYTCGQSSTGDLIPATSQVYLIATGGTTSTTSTTPNAALSMVTAVGPCANLSAAANTVVNELTTAAAAWALSPFSASVTSIGATATNSLGIQNAFLDASLLVNPASGTLAMLPAYLTTETGKLSALADALAICNTDPTTCGALFTAATPPSGIAPGDTFTAALDIVENPGQNVAAIFASIPATPPFPTTLMQSPNDWTMSLTVTGGGLASPIALAIDKEGNVWVANEYGPLSAFDPQGTPLSSTGFAAGDITLSYGIAVDTSDNIWVTNANGYQAPSGGTGSVTEILGFSSGNIGNVPQPTGFSNGLYYPYAVAADTNGNIFIANEEAYSATVFNSTGGLVTADLGSNIDIGHPYAIAIDATHGFWLTSDGSTVAHVGATGDLIANTTCCMDSDGVAVDASGNAWVADYDGNAFAEISGGASGALITSGSNTGGLESPAGVAIDSAQNVWIANYNGQSVTKVAGNAGTVPAGTAISPSTGVYGTGGYGLDAGLSNPYTVEPDRSGNLWVSNTAANAVTMFFGLAAPTVTPLQPVPTAP